MEKESNYQKEVSSEVVNRADLAIENIDSMLNDVEKHIISNTERITVNKLFIIREDKFFITNQSPLRSHKY